MTTSMSRDGAAFAVHPAARKAAASRILVTFIAAGRALMVTAPVGQRAAHGPQYQHSSTCMYALSVSGSMASESSGHMSTHRRQPVRHSEPSMVTGTSDRFSAKDMRDLQNVVQAGRTAAGTRRSGECG